MAISIKRPILNLKKARRSKQLGEFVEQHNRKLEVPRARERFMRLLDAMARSSRSDEQTSKQEPCED
jgi:hypothetical protein